MLAQNFMTAADLGLTEPEQGALIKVLGMLERGEITESAFAMESFDCGTTACICGWARRVGGTQLFDQSWVGNAELHKLFGGNADEVICCRDPAAAATALRSYLTTAKANWRDALG